jgi:hypothetical protein
MRTQLKPTQGRRLVTGAAVVAIVILAALGCADQGPGRLSGRVPSNPDQLLAELKAHEERVNLATQDMMQRIDAFNASRQPGERTVQFSDIFTDSLNDAQRTVLNQMVAAEKDVSYKSLLERIVSDLDQIDGLKNRITRLEQALPGTYVVAKAGDTHTALAMHYLRTEAGLDEAKAKELLADTDRTDELLPGNHVYSSYDAELGVFRTYVTKGEAATTPLALRRAKQRELIGERDTALATVAELEQVRTGLQSDIIALQTRKSELEANTARLEQRNAALQANVEKVSGDLAFRENSLFYHVANEKEMKEQKVLTSVMKRMRDVKGIDFDSALDLRQGTSITLDPGRYGLARIGEVRLLPSIYQQGRDFRIDVSKESGTATVVILDSDLFRGKEILLTVGG